MQSSSQSLLSWTDGFATKNADFLILLGRILLAWVFVGVAYGTITNFAGSLSYFTSLKLPAPALFAACTVSCAAITPRRVYSSPPRRIWFAPRAPILPGIMQEATGARASPRMG